MVKTKKGLYLTRNEAKKTIKKLEEYIKNYSDSDIEKLNEEIKIKNALEFANNHSDFLL